MQFLSPSGQEPVTWWRQFPVYLATILAAAHLVALVVTGVFQAVGAQAFISEAILTRNDLLNGEIWRAFTFPFVQWVPPSDSSAATAFWTLLGIFFLWYFGMEVERALGWRRFLRFYLILCYLPCLVILCLPRVPFYMGTPAANFAVFIGFAVLYPDIPLMLLGVKVKWWAWGMLFIVLLQGISNHDFTSVFPLVSAAAAYLILKLDGVRGGFGWMNRWRAGQEERRVERVQRRKQQESKEHFISERVDPILDKISREGIQSLTEEERRILERAKDKLR